MPRGTGDRVVLWFGEVGKADVAQAGGKGASLGALTEAGAPVPPGFIVTTDAYSRFLRDSSLTETISRILHSLDHNEGAVLESASSRIKGFVSSAPFPDDIAREAVEAYRKLGGGLVAVRSSATAEDLPEASFAGQQATFLNVSGEADLLTAIQGCWASLFEARAIFYRCEQGYDHLSTAIAVVVQRMVQSEVSGVMFTADPVSSDRTRMEIEAVFGLGEGVVSGVLTPDRYVVGKGTLRVLEKHIVSQERMLIRNPGRLGGKEEANIWVDVSGERRRAQKLPDEAIVELARIGRQLEEANSYPQDIEWAQEGGRLYVLQCRPITTLGDGQTGGLQLEGLVLAKGAGASPGAASGPAMVISGVGEMERVKRGDVLVAEMTTPDFVPAMKRAVAIVTDKGGRTCHAAIVSRELGIPCVVGAGNATRRLVSGTVVTVDGTHGQVYEGKVALPQEAQVTTRRRYKTRTRVYVNLADPELADVVAQRDVDGVGLLRAEFIIAHIGEHPRYMLEQGRGHHWSQKLAEGIVKFAAAFYPRPVVYRTSDFKTNEYRNLKGGEAYEPQEENPMIGFRGCSRYLRDMETFRLEVDALKSVVQQYDNVYVMLPFVRTPEELAGVKEALERFGLSREKGIKLWMMAEVPSNVLLLEEFLKVGIDGISIGSNDLTQLILGCDRDNSMLAELFDERHPAVKKALQEIVTTAVQWEVTCSICGQAPSFYPELTKALVDWGITSISVSPDMIDRTREIVADVERKKGILPPQDQA
ncbi:MAG: phosphoenolpyruvate synthase [Chloroflexi bacterium]|nr:phosphoenolpyruvate synthase [Chloroflexota bacterium]